MNNIDNNLRYPQIPRKPVDWPERPPRHFPGAEELEEARKRWIAAVTAIEGPVAVVSNPMLEGAGPLISEAGTNDTL